jgi:membrane protein DedA with SNARE-associated domain
LIFSVLLACGFGLPIPEDIVLLAGGLLAFYGKADLFLMIVVSLAGVLIGDSVVYHLGARFGRQLTRKPFFHKILPPERLVIVQNKLHQHGNKLMFMARFMPGLRSPIFFSSGMLHLPFRVFFLYDGFAALISVPSIILAVHYGGDQFDKIYDFVRTIENGVTAAIFLIVVAVIGKWIYTYRKSSNEKIS